MRFSEIFRAAWGGRVLGFTPFTLLPGFRGAWGAGAALVTLIAIATTPLFARVALIALLFAGAIRCAVVELPQGAAEIFDLAFVREFLAFSHFDEFQHFLHLIHGALEDIHNSHHFINRLMDGRHAMFRLNAGHAFCQTLHAFDKRPGRYGRTARRERFGRGAVRTGRSLVRTFGAVNSRSRLHGVGCDTFRRGGRRSFSGSFN